MKVSYKDQLFIIYAVKVGEPYKALIVSKAEAAEYTKQVELRGFFTYRRSDMFDFIEIEPEFFVVAEAKSFIELRPDLFSTYLSKTKKRNKERNNEN